MHVPGSRELLGYTWRAILLPIAPPLDDTGRNPGFMQPPSISMGQEMLVSADWHQREGEREGGRQAHPAAQLQVGPGSLHRQGTRHQAQVGPFSF